jgi:hypothetical protein
LHLTNELLFPLTLKEIPSQLYLAKTFESNIKFSKQIHHHLISQEKLQQFLLIFYSL